MPRENKKQQKLREEIEELKKIIGNVSPEEFNALKKLNKLAAKMNLLPYLC